MQSDDVSAIIIAVALGLYKRWDHTLKVRELDTGVELDVQFLLAGRGKQFDRPVADKLDRSAFDSQGEGLRADLERDLSGRGEGRK